MNNHSTQRITELELQLMHLQNDFEALNETVLAQSRQLDELSVLLQRLTAKIEAVNEGARPRSLEDEKPPHY